MVGRFTIRDGINENVCSGRFNILHWRLLPRSVHCTCLMYRMSETLQRIDLSDKKPLCLVSNYPARPRKARGPEGPAR